MNNDYDIAKYPIGLYFLPNTAADILYKVIKDILTRCSLHISLCRDDGAANIHGKRTGVANRILKKDPAALLVHCLAHSLLFVFTGCRKTNTLDVVKKYHS